MRRARTAGYRINLVFVGLDDVQLSASRVKARVRRGGHDVPLPDVFRRFDRSMANLAIGLAIADRSYVMHLAKAFPIWAAGAIPLELRHPIASGSARLTL
jgi:predicted ABC-type ATPase